MSTPFNDGFEEGYRTYDPEAEAADRRRQQRQDAICAASYDDRMRAVSTAITHLEKARNALTATGRLDLPAVDHQIDRAVISLAPVVMSARNACGAGPMSRFDAEGREWVRL